MNRLDVVDVKTGNPALDKWLRDVAQAYRNLNVAGFTAGGDLSGSSTSQTVSKIQGIPVVTSGASAGQALVYNGTSFVPVTTGSFTAGGDLSGSSTNQTVTGLQTVDVSATTPTVGQGLVYNGSVWIPTTLPDVGGWITLAKIELTTQASQSLSVGSYVFDGYTLNIDTLTNCTAAIVNGSGLVVTGTNTGSIVFSASVRSTNFPTAYRYYGAALSYEFAASATYPWSSGTNTSRISMGYLPVAPTANDIVGTGKTINAGSLQQRFLFSETGGGTITDNQFLDGGNNGDDTWGVRIEEPTLIRAWSGIYGTDYPTSNIGSRGARYKSSYVTDWMPRLSEYYGRLQYDGATNTGTRATFARCRFRVR